MQVASPMHEPRAPCSRPAPVPGGPRQAVDQGAVAVLAERPLPDALLPVVVLPDLPRALGRLAAAFYEQPSRRVRVVGVVGSFGKTTTAWLARGMFEETGERCGMIGARRRRRRRLRRCRVAAGLLGRGSRETAARGARAPWRHELASAAGSRRPRPSPRPAAPALRPSRPRPRPRTALPSRQPTDLQARSSTRSPRTG